MRERTVAITGANGYVGSGLAAYLNGQGYHVHGMGRRPGVDMAGFIPFTLGGVNDYAPLDTIGTLIHCAYDFEARAWEDIVHVNVEGSLELLRAARKHGVRRIIFISSVCAYEGAVSHYGKSKLQLEKMASELGVINVRPGTVFSSNAKGIVGAMKAFAQKLPAVPLIGLGDQILYPCHRDDLCAVIMALMEKPDAPTAPVTAASEEAMTFRELMQLFSHMNNTKPLLIPVPYFMLYVGLWMADKLGIKTGLRGTDSLLNLTTPNLHLDMAELHKLGITFRPFSLEAFQS